MVSSPMTVAGVTSKPTSEYTPAVVMMSKNIVTSADDRHVALVADRDVEADEHQEHAERDQRLLGDLPAPRRRHRGVADGLLAGCRQPGGWNSLNSASLSFAVLVVGQRLGADLHRRPSAVADDDHLLGFVAERCAEHVLDLLHAWRRREGTTPCVPPSKSMPKVKPRITMLAIAIAMISAADREPHPALPDDLERTGAGVQPDEEAVPRSGRRIDASPRSRSTRRVRSLSSRLVLEAIAMPTSVPSRAPPHDVPARSAERRRGR